MKRILIIRLSAMGDAAMTVPAIAALREKYPQLKISILTTPFFQPFFRDIPEVDFVPFDKKNRHKGLLGIFRLWKDIRQQHKIDTVADLHNVLRSKALRMLFRLSGSRIGVIDKGRAEKKALVRPQNKILKPLRSTIQRYADVFDRLNFPITVSERTIRKDRPLPTEIEAVAGKKTNTWIGIAPFAQHEGKRYPLERMEQVISQLSEQPRHTLFIFGGGTEEQTVADEWAERYPGVVSAVGKVRLAQELDLIARLDAMVSMDSSAMHMASLEGVPVVSVWGATHPYAGFLGWGQNPENAVQLSLPCRPCSVYGNKPCLYGDYRCLNGIDPETIVEKIQRITA